MRQIVGRMFWWERLAITNRPDAIRGPMRKVRYYILNCKLDQICCVERPLSNRITQSALRSGPSPHEWWEVGA